MRTKLVRLEYRSLKTDTINPRVFVAQQTAAVAAGAQDRMWNFLDTFYQEQGTEYTNYVTEQYVAGLARQVPGLDFTQWNSARTVALAKTVIADDRIARSFGFHDTPAFRIGRTGGELHNFSGRHVVVYRKFRFPRNREGGLAGSPQPTAKRANPLSLIDASDIKKAIEEED